MRPEDILEELLRRFERYYNIKEKRECDPFYARAEFHSHNEQYFLVKKAKLAEEENNEYVYFAALEDLNLKILQELELAAWEDGLARVTPHSSHRSSDIVLIIIADSVSDEAKEYIKKLKRQKNYKYTFHGWSDFRIAVLDLSSTQVLTNRRGKNLKPLLENLIK